MTKHDKAALLEAAEMIDVGRYIFSCNAVENAGSIALLERYNEFYGHTLSVNKVSGLWMDLYSSDQSEEQLKERRMLLILFFAEAG